MHPKIVPDLFVFREVVQQGSITQAARRLHTVQSNVTARIRKLEEELGSPLLHRHAKGIKMTAAGERLLPWVTKMDEILREISSEVRSHPNQMHGSLRLGSIETVASLQLAPLLADFGQSFPGIDISLQTGSSSKLTALLLASELDYAFVSGPLSRPGVDQELILEDRLAIAAPHGIGSLSGLALRRDLKILFQRPDCSYTRRMEAFLAAKKIQLQRAMQLAALDGILGCVAAGIGVAALPASMINQATVQDSISVFLLPKSCGSLKTYLARRRDQKPSPALERFAAATRRSALVWAR